jgi:hypothetical protein
MEVTEERLWLLYAKAAALFTDNSFVPTSIPTSIHLDRKLKMPQAQPELKKVFISHPILIAKKESVGCCC